MDSWKIIKTDAINTHFERLHKKYTKELQQLVVKFAIVIKTIITAFIADVFINLSIPNTYVRTKLYV